MQKLAVSLMWISSSALAQFPADPLPSNLTFRLEYATRDADAHHDCPSQRRQGYAEDFQQRYGERIKRLKKVHIAKSGPDPDFAVLSDCRESTLSAAEENDRHRRAMNDFERTMRDLEREFGGY